MIQVYCTVENNNDISFTWTLNGMTLLNDPPHIRIRSITDGSSDTTSVLTVDNFRDTDNGDYQCTVIDTVLIAASNGTAVSLTGTYVGTCYTVCTMYDLGMYSCTGTLVNAVCLKISTHNQTSKG